MTLLDQWLQQRHRGAVEIHYDDDLAPFHCPHCGMEFAPDDVLCISCGFEYADEQHPYHTALRRPAPVFDFTRQLSAADIDRLTDAVRSLSESRGMEILLAVFPAEINRPPEEIAWFYANQWELGGVTSDPTPAPRPPEEMSKLILAALLEIVLLPWSILKSLGQLIWTAIKPPPAPSECGLLIAVFPHWRTITLEPTIAASDAYEFTDTALQSSVADAAASLGTESQVDGLLNLIESLK